MSNPAFVFVHGSCHGAWCWRDVITALHALGHSASALDLPPYEAGTSVTLDDYARAIDDSITAHSGTTHSDAPVILVGHSAGGYAITAAAARTPEKIAKLIYVCAYVPKADMSLAAMRRSAERQPVMDLINILPDGQAFEFRADTARDGLFHDCPKARAEDAMTRLVPQPIAPQNTPVAHLERTRHIPRHYIRCLHDRVIPPEEQVKMTSDWPTESVTEMPCGHSPFLADPETLAQILAAQT
jgi:pimeloyl-ACP methyl ester carboxylesterase